MIDDSTLLHGTGATGEHPAYFILDNVSDNRIKLPHYGSYEPVESIAPAGYLKSISNFAGDVASYMGDVASYMGDVASYMGFEEGGDVSQMGYRDDSPYKDRDYIDIKTEEGLIDMSNTGKTLLGVDENGYSKVMSPYSGLHKFTGTTVREIPIPQDGGMGFNTMDPNTKLVRQRTKSSGS